MNWTINICFTMSAACVGTAAMPFAFQDVPRSYFYQGSKRQRKIGHMYLGLSSCEIFFSFHVSLILTILPLPPYNQTCPWVSSWPFVTRQLQVSWLVVPQCVLTCPYTAWRVLTCSSSARRVLTCSYLARCVPTGDDGCSRLTRPPNPNPPTNPILAEIQNPFSPKTQNLSPISSEIKNVRLPFSPLFTRMPQKLPC